MRALLCMEVMVIFMITSGCATYGELEKDYGKSYSPAKYNQILNPGAEANLKPVEGLPGPAAEEIAQKYVQSFARSANTTVNNPTSPATR